MGEPIKSVIPNIDELERERDEAPEPFKDVVMIPIPMPTWKALSDIAAKKNMTAAQLISRAFTIAIEE